MNISLKDKVAIITGASSGLGAEIAILFSKIGAKIVLNGRNQQGIDDTVEKCGGLNDNNVAVVLGDVRERDVLDNLVNTAIEKFGKIDILINNAGTNNGFENIENISMKSFDEVMNINLRSVVELTHLCIKHLIEQKGSIVNISSVCGTNPYPNVLPYQLSKSALDQFTKCVSLEVGNKGVRVNSVNPGVIPTNLHNRVFKSLSSEHFNMTAKLSSLGRNGKPDEVAKIVAFLASDESAFITGDIIHIDGGMHNVPPQLIRIQK